MSEKDKILLLYKFIILLKTCLNLNIEANYQVYKSLGGIPASGAVWSGSTLFV